MCLSMTKKRASGALVLSAALVVLLGRSWLDGHSAATDGGAIALNAVPYDLTADPLSGRLFISTATTASPPSLLPAARVAVIDRRTRVVIAMIPVGVNAGSIVVDTRAHRAFVLNPSVTVNNGAPRGGVTVLDTARVRVVRTIPLAGQVGQSEGLALDLPTGHLFVTDAQSSTVNMLDAATGVVVRRIAVGRTPASLADDAATGHVFVTNQGGNSLGMLDARSGRVLRSVPVGRTPARVVVDARRHRVFVGNYQGASVSMVDTRSGRVLATTGVGGAPNDMALDPHSGHLFVVVQSANTVGPGSVAMLNATSGRLLGTVLRGVFPIGIAADARRGRVVVTMVGPLDSQGNPVHRGTAYILEGRTGRVRRTIVVGLAPYNVAVDDRAGQAFVANAGHDAPVADPWAWVPQGLRRWLSVLPQPQTRGAPGSVTVVDLTR